MKFSPTPLGLAVRSVIFSFTVTAASLTGLTGCDATATEADFIPATASTTADTAANSASPEAGTPEATQTSDTTGGESSAVTAPVAASTAGQTAQSPESTQTTETLEPTKVEKSLVWRGNDTLGEKNWKERWGLVAWNEATGALTNGYWGTNEVERVSDPYDANHQVLRVKYVKDGVTTESGAGMLFQPPMKLDDEKKACLSFDFLFDKDFDFGEIGGKLPGLYGYNPDSGVKLDATVCAGPYKYDSASCFSARFSYRNLSSLGYPKTQMFYEAIPWMYEGECRSTWLCDLPYGEGMVMKTAKPETFAPIKGKWTNIRQEIRLNDHGMANGYMRVWYENALVYDEQNLTITLGGKVPVSGILFHALFGQGIDLTQGSPVTQYSYFANFQVANSCDDF